MDPAVTPPLGIVAYLALFVVVAILFLLVNLVVGAFIRSRNPSRVKGQIYECGEPSIGSGFIQFDIRFYVVALVFIIFDVEIAFFFPWATVFGKTMQLASTHPGNQVVQAAGDDVELTTNARCLYRELGVMDPKAPQSIPASPAKAVDPKQGRLERTSAVVKQGARRFALMTLADIGIFFGVLVVGFAYVWYRRDLDWVRSLIAERSRIGKPADGDQEGEADLDQVLSV